MPVTDPGVSGVPETGTVKDCREEVCGDDIEGLRHFKFFLSYESESQSLNFCVVLKSIQNVISIQGNVALESSFNACILFSTFAETSALHSPMVRGCRSPRFRGMCSYALSSAKSAWLLNFARRLLHSFRASPGYPAFDRIAQNFW